jgi:uncharacterized membrane protein
MRDPVWTTIDGEERLDGLSPRRQALNRTFGDVANAASAALARHWLLLVNLSFALIVGGALAVPVLYALGWQGVASRLFMSFHLICAQIPSHSYFLFGYQLGMCARNLAIFGSLLVGSVTFRSVRTRLFSLGWPLWLLTLAPMALDGGTQLFGWRESTWELRTLTGVIFGLGVCWFVLPQIEAAAHGGTPRRRRLSALRLPRLRHASSSHVHG